MSNNSVIVKIPTFKDTMVNHYFLFSNFPRNNNNTQIQQQIQPTFILPKRFQKLFTILVHK